MSESQPVIPPKTTDETSKKLISSLAPSRTSKNAAKALTAGKTTEKIREPGYYDVLLGRGRTFENHVGNQHFHDLITINIDRYAASNVQLGKWKITMDIVEAVVVKGGRFLKPPLLGQTGWTVVPIEMARQKVAHSLQYHQRRLVYLTKDESSSILEEESEESADISPTNVKSMEEWKYCTTTDLLDISIRDMKPLSTTSPTMPTEKVEDSLHSLVTRKKQKDVCRRVSTDLCSVVEAVESTERVPVVPHHHYVKPQTQSLVSPVSSTRSVYLPKKLSSSEGFRSPPRVGTIQRTSHQTLRGSHNKTSAELFGMSSIDSSMDTVTEAGPYEAPQAVTPEYDSKWVNRQFRPSSVNTRSEGRDPMMMQGRSLSVPLPNHQSQTWNQDRDDLAGISSSPHSRPASGFIKRAFARHEDRHHHISFQENYRPQPASYSTAGRGRDSRILNSAHEMNPLQSVQQRRSVSLPLFDRTMEHPWREHSRAYDAEMAFHQSPYVPDMDDLSEYAAAVATDDATAALSMNPMEWNKRKFQCIDGSQRRCASGPFTKRCPPPYMRSYSSDYVLSSLQAQERRLALAKLFNLLDTPKESHFSAGMAFGAFEDELEAFQKFRQSRGRMPEVGVGHMSQAPCAGNFDFADVYDEYDFMMMQHPDYIAFCQSQEEAFISRTRPALSAETPVRKRPFTRPDCDPVTFGSVSGYPHLYPHDQVPAARPPFVATLPSDPAEKIFANSALMDGVSCDSLMNQPLNDDFFVVGSEVVDDDVLDSKMREDANQYESWNHFHPEDSLELFAPRNTSSTRDADDENLGLEIEEWTLTVTPN